MLGRFGYVLGSEGLMIQEPMTIEWCALGRYVAYPERKQDPVEGLWWGVIALQNGALVFQGSSN